VVVVVVVVVVDCSVEAHLGDALPRLAVWSREPRFVVCGPWELDWRLLPVLRWLVFLAALAFLLFES
jgi:hypothetical protein